MADMSDSNNIIGLLTTGISLLAAGVGTMVLVFMSGLKRDIREVVIKIEKQQDQIADMRVGMAKLQEQLYTILRGGPPMAGERTERGGT